MTIPTTQDADSFRTGVHRRLGIIAAALHDLADCGPTDATARLRVPTRQEQSQTERADGRYEPTPAGTTRSSGRSDIVLSATVAAETTVQHAVTDLWSLVAAAAVLADHLALQPYDNAAQPLTPPDSPPVDVSQTTGKVYIAADVTACRRSIRPAIAWCGAVYDQLADRMMACDDPDTGDHLTGEAAVVVRDLERMVRRLDAGPRLTTCQQGCRHLAGTDGWCDLHRPRRCQAPGECRKPAETGRTVCAGCRKADQRARGAA